MRMMMHDHMRAGGGGGAAAGAAAPDPRRPPPRARRAIGPSSAIARGTRHTSSICGQGGDGVIVIAEVALPRWRYVAGCGLHGRPSVIIKL
jgi:hypothetical protein